jgi:hypothetical protein
VRELDAILTGSPTRTSNNSWEAAAMIAALSQVRRDDRSSFAFIDALQGEVIHKILKHCGLWQDPPSRAPPQAPRPYRPARSIPEPGPAIASGITYKIDLDFLEHAHREDLDQPELPWDPS